MKDFVIFPRQVIRDYRDGKLSPTEFFMYCYIRLLGNPYGVSSISLENLRSDVLRGKGSNNYVNKILLSLKGKKYIHFSPRTGRRGSFTVQLGNWKLPNKTIKRIENLFNSEGSDVLPNEQPGDSQSQVTP